MQCSAGGSRLPSWLAGRLGSAGGEEGRGGAASRGAVPGGAGRGAALARWGAPEATRVGAGPLAAGPLAAVPSRGGSGRGAALRVRGPGLPARLEVRRGELRRGARREGPSRPWRGGCTRDPRHGARRAAARCEGRRGRCEARSRGKARGARGGGDEVRRVAAVPRCRLLASPPRAQAQASSRLGRRR